MSSIPRLASQIEPLEARIAPAVVINNPIPDLVAGIGKTGATIDLGKLTAADADDAYRTTVRFITNYDTDPTQAGIQAGVIEIELYDDLAPLSVQNFLAYVTNTNPKADYDGTLLHRADFLANGNPFVLQGGGFDAAKPSSHIPVFPPVHNEADIVNRSNLEGTVAMAKVGGNPNSATSEWFINLGDNSANLDAQNGGFTVFGKVTPESLALAKTIANLNRVDVGTGFLTPTQDGRPIAVVDSAVIPPAASGTTGLTYTIQSVLVAGTTTVSDLVTPTISGTTLSLPFVAGKSGRAEVTVAVSDGTDTVTDTFIVDVRPNMIVELNQDSLPRFLLPGDAGNIKFTVINTGAVTGSGTVNVYLSKVTVTKNAFGQITEAVEVSPVSKIDLSLAGALAYNVATGKGQSFSVPVKLPSTPFDGDEVIYKVITEVVPGGEERFSDDNKSLQNSLHAAVNKFGTLSDINFGIRTNAVLKYSQNIGGETVLVTWTMKGPGTGMVGFDATKENISLTTLGTSLASTVAPTFSKFGSRITLDSVNFNNPIGIASLGSVDVSGLIAVSGGIKTLTLGDLSGNGLLLISPVITDPNAKATLNIRQVTDFSIESSQPLAGLTVGSWADTGGRNDTIVAPSLGTLKVNGDFAADLTLVDELPITSIKVTGTLKNATIKTAGNIGSVVLGGIDSANVFAGVDSRPDALSDFTNARTIQSFTTGLFVNSQVAAQTIGSIIVKGAAASGAGTDYGFVADVIKSYSRSAISGGAPALIRTNLTTPQTVDDLGDYIVKIL